MEIIISVLKSWSPNEAIIPAHIKYFKIFRHCDHVLSKELDKIATTLLQDLVRFQDKKFAEDPVKAKARRRYVVGLREATKYMKVSHIENVSYIRR